MHRKCSRALVNMEEGTFVTCRVQCVERIKECGILHDVETERRPTSTRYSLPSRCSNVWLKKATRRQLEVRFSQSKSLSRSGIANDDKLEVVEGLLGVWQ